VKTSTHEFGGISVVAPHPWIDTTDDVKVDDAPFTLAKQSIGIGALQFSIAHYREGEEPNIIVSDLKKLLADFADNKNLGDGFDKNVYENRLSIVGASYHFGSDLIRIWYCSDETNVALITYVCDWEKRGEEVKECEDIVKSVRFS
jgi:hypothetical protein